MKGDLAQGDVTLVTEKLEVSGEEWRWPSDEETRSWDRVGRGGGGEERLVRAEVGRGGRSLQARKPAQWP